ACGNITYLRSAPAIVPNTETTSPNPNESCDPADEIEFLPPNMNGKAPRDDGSQVLDSTDWLATPLPKLSAVEAALRCQVCKDFYENPMITSCSHTFCSLCIRRALGGNGLCPGCRTPDQEVKLKFNNTVYDMVEAFKAARPEIVEYTRERPTPIARSASPKRSREDSELGSVEDGPSTKRTRSSRRLAPQPATRVIVVDSDVDDEDFIPEKGVVQCPVCQKLVKEVMINSHLDRGCMDEPNRPRSSKGSIQSPAEPPSVEVKRPERLAQLNYSMVKDGPLKRKLVDQGVSAMGSRQMLERRFTEWVTLWNSNCDARFPKGKSDLKRELEVWERTQGVRAQASYSMDPGSQIKDKNFDGKAWANKHDDSFRDLIANARRKLPTKPVVPPVEAEEPSATGPIAFVSPYATPAPTHTERKDNETTANSQPQSSLQNIPNASYTSADGPDGAQRRFFDEGSGNSTLHPSSQYSNGIPILENDTGISSDTSTMKTIQQ
ncbi:Postreplication repair E3 ubiquitin-protein ligase, partial [Lachnellula subtilissima]